ncbi:MAG: alpha-L-arabinofuranosidase C-terminal domain-containing protein [Candidatus Omnitrophota bacterium]
MPRQINLMVTALGIAMLVLTTGIAQSAESGSSQSVEITIDASKTKEPISKYIYGQFIEHLGRCIYGGIWSEMLEDRKFYFPITPEFKPWSIDTDRDHWKGGDFPVLTGSPWKIVGDKKGVLMTSENSFVGEQTPEILLAGKAGGVEQGELALLQDKEYAGYIILAGDAAAAPIQISLIWGDGDSDKETVSIEKIVSEYVKYPFHFQAKASTSAGRLQIAGQGKGAFKIGTVSLMPADHVDGFRPDTLQLLKELNSPVYRWPGGNFVSDYNWKDGVGDRDKRPPRKNPAWTGIEPNDVGIHEFMNLCNRLGAEPYIAVNTGLGAVEAAAEEVEYCNGSADSPMGKWRAQNGHPLPFRVKWWAVGNEMYGSWQKGHMPLEDYMKKHNRCAELMRAADPSIQLVAVGAVGDWSRNMLTYCADHMDLISEHIYRKNKDGLVEHAAQIREDIKRVADEHRSYRATIKALEEKNIRIAMDEWNYWYGQYIYGELGCRYHLQDALGIAAGLHEYFRNSDIYFMANYAQTVNVIGAIKTTKTEAQFDATGLVLKLYRNHFGEIPVEVGDVPPPLDAAAAWTPDLQTLTIAVVNPTQDAIDLSVELSGAALADEGKMSFITGPDKMAYNEPGREPKLRIEEKTVSNRSGNWRLPALSVSLFEFPKKQ